jgi:hypothetical protein
VRLRPVDSLRRAQSRKGAQVGVAVAGEMDDATSRTVIYPKRSRKSQEKSAIDHEHIASKLRRRGMTISLLSNGSCDTAVARGEEPYIYSAFCREHRDWARRNDVRMRIEHRPAEAIQVDWIGDIGEVIDPDTSEVLKVYMSAACL